MVPESTGDRRRRKPGASYSKNGCLTCRTRRIKCDETFPACQRCRQTGRTCDGPTTRKINFILEQPDQIARLSPPVKTPSALPWAHARETAIFAFFLQRVAPIFAGSFDSPFWQKFLPQLSHTDRSIWDATLAIGTLFSIDAPIHRRLAIVSTTHDDYTRQHQAMKWYTRALSGFNSRLAQEPHNLALALLSCILCMSVEFSQPNFESALALMRQGFSMLSSLMKAQFTLSDSTTADLEIVDMVLPFFSRHQIAMSMFGLPQISEPELQRSLVLEGGEAVSTLLYLLLRAWEFLRNSMIRINVHPTPVLFDNQQILISQLKGWRELLRHDSNVSGILLAYHSVALTWISACFEPVETAFDDYFDEYGTILEHMKAFFDAKQDDITGIAMPLIPPLFFVALKCRHLVLRRQARDLIEKASIWCSDQDFWNLMSPVDIADALITLEHGDMTNPQDLPPEAARISIIELFRMPASTLPRGIGLRTLKLVDFGDGVRRVKRRVLDY